MLGVGRKPLYQSRYMRKILIFKDVILKGELFHKTIYFFKISRNVSGEIIFPYVFVAFPHLHLCIGKRCKY